MAEKEAHPNLYIIAGPNGAGKTTFALQFLPNFAGCREFINADLIATGLSPLSPTAAAMEAGRVVLRKIKELSARRHSFGFETTLAGRSYLSLFRKLRVEGYRIHMTYLWLPTPELAIRRVQDRVRRGGHSVPEPDIRRRFSRGLKNLFHEYLPLLHTVAFHDNSGSHPRLIAFGDSPVLTVHDRDAFEQIKRSLEP